MRICSTVCALAVVSAGLALATFAGCASHDQDRMDARESAASLRKTLSTTPAQVDSTVNALVQATSGDNTNRLERFRDFKTRFSALKENGRYIGDHAKRARADSAAYFKEWAAESVAADPSKKAKMTPAIEGRMTNYTTALGYLDGGRDAYIALVAELGEIEKTLDADLSLANSAEVGKKVNTAKLHGVDLKSYIAVLSDRIDSALATK
jgi:hypothetical protein